MKKFIVVIMIVVMVFVSTSAMANHGGHHGGGNGIATGFIILGGIIIAGIAVGLTNSVIKAFSQPAPAPAQQPVYGQQPDYDQRRVPEQQLDHEHYVVKETKDVLGKVEVLVGSPNGKGPAQIQGQRCFPNGVLFPYGARLFDYNNREVGYVPRGGTYKPGECLYD